MLENVQRRGGSYEHAIELLGTNLSLDEIETAAQAISTTSREAHDHQLFIKAKRRLVNFLANKETQHGTRLIKSR
jgi:hypothetical protein